jgi:hypothetical protein
MTACPEVVSESTKSSLSILFDLLSFPLCGSLAKECNLRNDKASLLLWKVRFLEIV